MITPERLREIETLRPWARTWVEADKTIAELIAAVRPFVDKLDPMSVESVRAAAQKIIDGTSVIGVVGGRDPLAEQVATLATRLALSEGLIGAMGRANDELGGEIERLKLEREALRNIVHAEYCGFGNHAPECPDHPKWKPWVHRCSDSGGNNVVRTGTECFGCGTERP